MKKEQAEALRDALAELKKDPAAFKKDPKGKVPKLSPEAAQAFKGMSDETLAAVGEVDEAMKKAGFTHDVEGVTLRMV